MIKREEALCPVCKVKMNKREGIWFCKPCEKLFFYVPDVGHYELEQVTLHKPKEKVAKKCPSCGNLWDISKFPDCPHCGMKLKKEKNKEGETVAETAVEKTDADDDIDDLLD